MSGGRTPWQGLTWEPGRSISWGELLWGREVSHRSCGRALTVSTVAMFLAARLLAQLAPPLSPAAIAARATPATVTILTFTVAGDTLGQGSGFIVRASGVIITNWHVIAGAGAATIILASGERYSRVLYLDGDSTRDVALLQIPGAGLPVLPVRNDLPPPGSRVVVIGSPLGLARTVTDGVVSATRVVQGLELVQVSAPISHGSSGGPILDSRGRVFAIASAFLAEGQQLNFAVPVRYAMGLLALQPTPRPLSTSPAGLAPPAAGRESSTSWATTLWTAPRASKPLGTLGGAYSAFRWVQTTSEKGVKEPATTDVDFIVAMDSGYGWRGYSCDSLQICDRARSVAARTAASGDVVLDLGYVALDGYQTDSGFIAHGQFIPTTGGTTVVWLRAWRFTAPLSRRSGVYACTLRAQYVNGNYRGDFADWAGEAATTETRDSTYLRVYVVNSAGGSTGGVFVVGRHDAADFRSTHAGVDRTVRLDGRWSFGHFYADLEDSRKEGGRFVGPLSCNRK